MSWLNDGGFLESSRNPGSIFLDEKLNDLLLYSDLPQQNILFGTNQSNLSSLKLTSNMTIFNYNISIKDALGLGNSNLLHNSTLHKFVMTGPSNSIDSPNIGIYTNDDSNNPILQIHNNQRDDLAIGFDAYKDNSNIWKSSDTHANFAIIKKDGCFNLWNASGVPRGSSNMNWRVALAVNSNGFIGIGASNRLTHRVNIIGDMAFYTTASEHPMYQMLHHDNNNITHSYDSYSWDNRWISSTSNGNFRIAKSNGMYGLYSACNVSTSSNITWDDAFIVKDDGRINIGNTTPLNSLYRLNVVGPASNLTQGPHLGFYLSNTPIVQLLNFTHDDIHWGFDTCWNGSNWSNVDKSAFRIAKSNSTFGIHSSCNINNWESAFTIGADSRIGIGTNNRIHRININGDHTLTAGPNIGFYSRQNALPMLQMLNLGSNNMHVAMDAYWTSSNWIATSTGNFLFSKSNSLYSISTACNIQTGSNITDWKTALVLGNDGRIGIGGSNMDHKITMRARRSNADGPHMAFYIQEDPLHPLVQHRNWDHNEINYSLDAYWSFSSNRWISSDSNTNYRFDKRNAYTLWTASNIPPGNEITSWQNAFMVHGHGHVGIGGSNSVHRFTLEGPAVNVRTESTGPNMAIFFTGDSNPVFQHRNRNHDDISQSIDAYWSFSRNAWISSDSRGNFIMEKRDGKYTIYASCNFLPGSVIDSRRIAFMIHGNNFVGLGTNNPTYRFTMVAPSNNTAGPHLAFYTDDDLVFPLYQMRNLRHDDISHTYDAYWATEGWIAGNSNVFRVAKSNGTYGIYSSCNSTSNVSWRNAFIVCSDTRITMGGGVGRAHRLNIVGDRNSLTTGPNMAFYSSNLPPMLQLLNLDHNNINTGMDAYWDGSNWISSFIDGNFRVAKSNGVYGIYSSCNVDIGGVITWKPAVLVGSDGRVSIGGTSATGAASKFVVTGSISNLDGPHVTFNFHETVHPVVQQVNMAHDAIYHGLDAYLNFASNQWISSDSSANFRVAKADGRYVISTACNVAPGLKIDWSSALTIDRTGFIGIGDQVTHKLTMRAPQNSSAGPHEAIYVLEDSNHPLNQRVNMAHDAIYHGLDAYWNFASNQWISSDSNANFRVAKADGRYVISTACNVAPGNLVSWTTAFMINRDSFVCLGGNQPTHRFTIRGPANNTAGPHMAFYVDGSSNPVSQFLHNIDNISTNYDCYMNESGNWTSSSSNGNFRLAKTSNTLGFYYASSNIHPGAAINNWTTGLSIASDGRIGIGGHSLGFFYPTAAQPALQILNMGHDNTSINFDSYFEGARWVSSSSSGGHFRITKSNGFLGIYTAAPGTTAGASINTWSLPSMIIDSRTGYLGLHTANAPEYAVDIHSEVFYRSNVHHDAHVLPNLNATYDLGSYNKRWRDLYGNSINMNDLILKKDNSSGGLQVYNNNLNAVARVWVKEILVGDPTSAVNSNVVLIKATQTGLNFENITESVSQANQDPISIVPNLYQNGPNFGLNVKNPTETLASLETFSMSNFGKIIMYTSNNRLGLNIAVPTETLTIGGNMSLSNNTGKIALHTSNNNLGVGIVTPGARLQVAGDLLAGYSHLGTSSTTTGGPYFHHKAWTANHTISYPEYCFGDNSSGNLYIQISNKSTVVSKIANIHLSFLKRAGVAIDLFTVMLHKSATMTNLSVSSNLNDIVINTDSDCFIAWTTIGSY